MKRFSLKFFLMLLVCLIYNDICSAQGQWQQIGENGLVASNAMNQSAAFDNEGTPYIAYQDLANNSKATVKKFDGNNWVTIGEAGFSMSYVKSLSLVVDGTTPYVAYIDNGNDAKAVVKKFNGKSWVNVGSTNLLVDYATGVTLAVNSKGVVYLAYQNNGNEGRATVKRFNGTSWINVGPNGFTKSYANNISLAFDGNDVPYISFVDEETGGKALVKKFNGKSWENLSSSGIDNNYVTGLSLAIDGSGSPYLLYRDEAADYKATLKRYNGKGWEVVGSAGFSDGKVSHTKLILSNGTPYVAYMDFGNGAIGNVGKANIKRFVGGVWESINYANLTTINNLDNAYSLALTADNSGNPYFAFSNKASGAKATLLKLNTTTDQNKRPVANAGDDIKITLPSKKVQLQGGGSDEDGTISSYQWRQVSGPNQAKFNNSKSVNPIVSNLVVGVYEFSLIIKDNKNFSSSADRVLITVLDSELPVQKIISYTLIDAETKKTLKTLSDGATINLAALSTKKLSIRTNTNTEVGSIVFELSGEQKKDVIENVAPYDLTGDNDFWTPVIGDYTIIATPFEKIGGKGTEGVGLEVNFSVIDDNSENDNGTQFPEGQDIIFTLIDADKNKDIQKIKNGATINLATLPSKNISIRVDSKNQYGSMHMQLSGKQSRNQIESIAPYSLFGGNNGNYNPWLPVSGSYTLEITPYSGKAGKGTASAKTTITFDVIDQPIGFGPVQASTAARKKQITETPSISNAAVVVYPNPTASKLNVEISEAGEGVATINLLDTSGRKVLTKQLSTTTNLTTVLDVDQLHPGVYILVINSAKGRITKRVVIQ